MDIKHVADHECISCGECVDVCPTGAISWKGSKIILPENEIVSKEERDLLSTEALSEREEAVSKKNKKLERRRLITKIVAAVLMVCLLASALIYHNFIDIDKVRDVQTPGGSDGELVVGNAVGNLCPSYSVDLIDETGMLGESFDPSKNHGKVTVINFWYTTCPGCVKELPYFDRVATEYKDTVTVLAVHATVLPHEAKGYIEKNYKDSDILFGMDVFDKSAGTDEFFSMLGGGDAYPITVILGTDGVIIASLMREVTYEELTSIISAELSEKE
jgi:thiol-disulfide isomerase/thioredoxin